VSAADQRKARWAAKKATADQSQAPSAVTRVTGLVDQLVANGEFEAYTYTREQLEYELEKRKNLRAFATETTSSSTSNADKEFDMFAEKIDDGKNTNKATTSKDSNVDSKIAGGVQWEFKWENTDSAKIHGPVSSEQMQEWAETGYFKEGVWVHKVGDPNAQFYTSRRIDFDLYT